MNIGAFSGVAGSLSGTSSAQAKGEADRVARETADRAREVQAVEHAEAAADVGEDEDDVLTGERDADGRELWERREKKPVASDTPSDAAAEVPAETSPQSKDPTGEAGGLLDISG